MIKRRKLGKLLHDPIEELYRDKWIDSIILIESDSWAAMRTRAAALMYIHRNDLDLHTVVKGNEIYILKEKDFMGSARTYDLRERSDKQ